jgi:tetratricopeptide (TPR) repeat protein
LLGRAKRIKGDYKGALDAFEEQLKVAKELADPAQVASSHSEIGRVLVRQAAYPEALEHFESSYETIKSIGEQLKLGYNLLDRANLLWQLGRYPEAHALLEESSAQANKPGSQSKALLAGITECSAEMALSERDLVKARAASQKALALAGTEYHDTAIEARLVLGLVQVLSGAPQEGRKTCEEADKMAGLTGDPWLISRSALALAEASLESGDAASALTHALRAQEVIARIGDQEAEWRAWLVAALASGRTNDQAKAREYAEHANGLLATLEQKWGTDSFNSYLARPDIQYARKRLSEIR